MIFTLREVITICNICYAKKIGRDDYAIIDYSNAIKINPHDAVNI